jgi:hypothetical protein
LADSTVLAFVMSAGAGILSFVAIRNYFKSRSEYAYRTLYEKFLAGMGVVLGTASFIFHWGLAAFYIMMFLQGYSTMP